VKIRRRLPALVAALLMPVASPLLLSTAFSTATLLVSEVPAQAQSAEAVGKVAQAITVKIEGATQGSGVLVERDGNRYTVLTAWHVVSGQKPGEELDIYTPDGQRHPVEQGSIKRLGEVDMAVLTFIGTNSYELASVGDVKSVRSGDQVIVAGFPISGNGKLKYDAGKLVANAAAGVDQGYQLLYDNDTISGMSGGVVLSSNGLLIGMHGRGELDEFKSRQAGRQIKTGVNQGVPISYYRQYVSGQAVILSSTLAMSADDFLAQAKVLFDKKGSEQEVVRLAGQALARKESAEGYFILSVAKLEMGDSQGAINGFDKAIALNPGPNAYNNRGVAKSNLGLHESAIGDFSNAIAGNPQFSMAYNNRAIARQSLGDFQGALADYDKAVAINPRDYSLFFNRAIARQRLGDFQGVIADLSQAIAINPQHANSYGNRGVIKAGLGDAQGAISDLIRAVTLDPLSASTYRNLGIVKSSVGDLGGAIMDYNQAISLNSRYADAYVSRGNARKALGDVQAAIADYSRAIEIDPQGADGFGARGSAKAQLGDRQGACEDMRKSASLGSPVAQKFIVQICQ